jgi:hypothetical protein
MGVSLCVLHPVNPALVRTDGLGRPRVTPAEAAHLRSMINSGGAGVIYLIVKFFRRLKRHRTS